MNIHSCIKKIVRSLAILTLSIIFFALNILPCYAQEISGTSQQLVATVNPPGKLTDIQSLEAFFDKSFAENMVKYHVPGATYALVKDGKILSSKGYGFADLEKQITVNPAQTLFHLGSISKLFTATAIMQLSERGLLNLNDDINKYLKHFQLENNYSQPVNFTHLLTHTAGFDERNIGIAARNVSAIKPLEKYLKKRIPPRVLPPGNVIQYSNHGMALAGYLVEVISAMPFAEYINNNIFRPLGMSHSSFLQPLPKSLEANLAQGYEYKQGKYRKVLLDYFNVAPAEALNATANDMAQFMLAHLQNGSNITSRILSENTTQEMHKQHFTYDSRLPGYVYGFYERFYNNQRAIGHEGNWHGFSSYLILLPSQKLGFFIAHNSSGISSRFNQEIIRSFFNHYYPVESQLNVTPISADIKQSNHQLVGNYRYKRYARFSLEKLETLLSQSVIKLSNDGNIKLNNEQLLPIQPLVFKNITNNEYVIFKKDKNNRITDLFKQDFDFEKLPWYESNTFQFSLFGFFIILSLYGSFTWVISHLFSKGKKHNMPTSKATRLVKLLTGFVSTLNLIFLISVIISFLFTNRWEFMYGVPPVLLGTLCIPLLSISATIGLLFLSIPAYQNKYWSNSQKLNYTFMMLALLVFMPFLNYWNLLGFRF